MKLTSLVDAAVPFPKKKRYHPLASLIIESVKVRSKSIESNNETIARCVQEMPFSSKSGSNWIGKFPTRFVRVRCINLERLR